MNQNSVNTAPDTVVPMSGRPMLMWPRAKPRDKPLAGWPNSVRPERGAFYNSVYVPGNSQYVFIDKFPAPMWGDLLLA